MAEKKSFWDGIIRDRDIDKEHGREKECETREKGKEREKDKEERERLWCKDPLELTRMIEYLTASSSEDWTLVLGVCERASATEANAKEAMKALRREFEYADPRSQLSAARLWEIMLRNASDIFLTQISSRKFIDTLEDVLTNSKTSPVVRERLMEVLAAATFITSPRPRPSLKSESSPFSLQDRDCNRDGFRALWARLKLADKPDVGIPFDTEDAMFGPPVVPTRPPIEERPSKKSPHQRGVIPPDEVTKRLFQECKIAKGNAIFLSEMLAYTKLEQIEGSLIPEFVTKCRGSQELIYTQIPWASAGVERLHNVRERNGDGNRHTEQQTSEEELLVALVDANEALVVALSMYDDVIRVAEECVTVDIIRGSNDVEMHRKYNENEHLGESHYNYGDGYSRTPSLPTLSCQTDLPLVIPSQTHPLPRIPFALSPVQSHYDSPPRLLSTSAMPAPPPPPMGPRSPKSPLYSPMPDRGDPARPSRGNLLERMDYLHTDSEEEFPIRPSAKALGQKRVAKVVNNDVCLTCSAELCQQYTSLSKADDAIRAGIHAQFDDTPLRLFDTATGLLCDREAQTCAFKLSTEYEGLLSSIINHAEIQMEHIKKVVADYFRCAMLSHRWEEKEPLLHDIKDKVVYQLNPVDGFTKLQSFCETARNMGYRWAWVDSCCIDQTNIVELQKSLNSMFDWYRHSALTIVYLSDVPPLSKPGALAKSAWNTHGWTMPEFLAPKIVLFYQNDWTLYLGDRSPNHKKSVTIMQELKDATGIDTLALIDFRPGMAGAREKLRWASTRVTSVQEDVAYSLFGIFGVHLPIIYGEKKQNALGRLLQEIVAKSGDITVLDWVGRSSEFNSCLPADITSYKAPPCALPSPTEDDIQASVSCLQNAVNIDEAFKLYCLLDKLGAPLFAHCRLRLHCIAFSVTEIRRSRAHDQEGHFAYEVRANGLRDLLITTEDKLTRFSRAKPILQTFLLVRPWHPHLLELPESTDNPHWSMSSFSVRESVSRDSRSVFSGETGPASLQSRALRLIVHLGQPFRALLLARQRGGEYKRIASDRDITAQVKDVVGSVHKVMDVRTLEIS